MDFDGKRRAHVRWNPDLASRDLRFIIPRVATSGRQETPVLDSVTLGLSIE